MRQVYEHATDPARPIVGPPFERLSPREREVVALIVEGLTNAEIAERLVIERGTVANHVEHIRRALRLKNRVQVAVWAVRQGLH
jgi:DNA-binding NarL/FixJ family response regulator